MNSPSPISSSHASTPTHSPSPSSPRSSTPVKMRTPSPGAASTPYDSPVADESSSFLDPLANSKIPGAKPPKPDKPPKPAKLLLMAQQRNKDPEWLTFSEKKRRFEQGLQHKKDADSKNAAGKADILSPESKRFSYLSQDELEKLREEEAKKLASLSEDQLKSMREMPEEDDDEEDDQFLTEGSQNIENYINVRTAKAERRYKDKLKKEGIDIAELEALSNLTPAQRRALEAEKRAAWRQARLKSLEDDAMRAQMVIAKVKEITEAMEARPVSPKMQVIDIDIDIDKDSYGKKIVTFN